LIGQVSAKLKALLRSAAARTVSDLWEMIHKAFARFSPEECRNYFTGACRKVFQTAGRAARERGRA
jgi:hypothetical protein